MKPYLEQVSKRRWQLFLQEKKFLEESPCKFLEGITEEFLEEFLEDALQEFLDASLKKFLRKSLETSLEASLRISKNPMEEFLKKKTWRKPGPHNSVVVRSFNYCAIKCLVSYSFREIWARRTILLRYIIKMFLFGRIETSFRSYHLKLSRVPF